MEDFDHSIGECFLPLSSTKNKLVCIMLHDDLSETELDQMAKTHIGAMSGMGFYQDAVMFGFTHTESTLEIYIKVPVFDVFNHLHSC